MGCSPADKWNIGIRAAIESWPMLAPTIGEWKVSFDFYFEPWENLYGFMDGNYRLSAREYMEMPRWIAPVGMTVNRVDEFELLSESVYKELVQPGSMWDMLEITPGFFGVVSNAVDGTYDVRPLQVNMEDWISYVDIFRNYYANPQEKEAVFTSRFVNGPGSSVNPNTFRGYQRVDISNLDHFMMDIRCMTPSDGLFEVIGSNGLGNFYDSAYVRLGGFFLRTYKMDLLRGVMNAEVGDYESTVEPDENGNISVTAFRTASGVQDMINEIDVSGGRFDRVQEMRWGKPRRSTWIVLSILAPCRRPLASAISFLPLQETPVLSSPMVPLPLRSSASRPVLLLAPCVVINARLTWMPVVRMVPSFVSSRSFLSCTTPVVYLSVR